MTLSEPAPSNSAVRSTRQAMYQNVAATAPPLWMPPYEYTLAASVRRRRGRFLVQVPNTQNMALTTCSLRTTMEPRMLTVTAMLACWYVNLNRSPETADRAIRTAMATMFA